MIGIFFLAVAIAFVDYSLDDRNANWHNFLHKAVYLCAVIWCVYWSILLASRIGESPQVLGELVVALGEITLALGAFLFLHVVVWKKQEANQKRYNSNLAQPIGVADDQERRLHQQAMTLANMLGLNENGVPNLLSDYGGYLQEIQMQFQANIRFRTNERILALMGQVTNGYEVLRKMRIAEQAFKEVQSENSANSLELEKRKLSLQVDIERLKKEFKEVNDPPKTKSQSHRNVTVNRVDPEEE